MKRLASNIYLLTLLMLTIGLLPLIAAYGGVLPLCDATTQLLPFLFETKRMLSGGEPFWSWNTYFGDDFLCSYMYYTVSRPLVWLTCLLPFRWLWMGLTVMVYAAFLLIAWLTDVYLRIMGFGRRLRVVGVLMFVGSSYMVTALEYVMFYEPVIGFLLLMIALERYLRGRKYGCTMLVLSSFAVAFINYYMMIGTFLAVAIYFFCRLAEVKPRQRLRSVLVAAGCVAVGLMMAGMVLVPMMMYLQGSSREEFYFAPHIANIYERLRALFMPSINEGHQPLYLVETGWYMNNACIPVFGVLGAAVYALRHRRSWLTVLMCIYLAIYLTPLNGIFSLFTSAQYTRWIYALVLACIVASLRLFSENVGKRLGMKALSVYLVVCTVVYAVFVGSTLVLKYRGGLYADREGFCLLLITVLFALSLAALCVVWRLEVGSRRWYGAAVASIMAVSAAGFWTIAFSHSSLGPYPMVQNSDYMSLIKNAGDSHVGGMHWRTYYAYPDFWVNIYHNSGIVNNTPSVSTYSSLRISDTNHLFELLGADHVSYTPQKYRSEVCALMSVKDVVSPQGVTPRIDSLTYVGERGGHTVWANENYIPMGYAYDTYSVLRPEMLTEEYRANTNMVKAMLNTLIISEEDEPLLRRYMHPAELTDTTPIAAAVARRRMYTCSEFEGHSRGYDASITLPDTMVVLFSVPAAKGFECEIDGEPSRIYNVNLGLTAMVVPGGTHHISCTYTTPGLRAGMMISVAGVLILLGVMAAERRRRKG